ncbi:MAG TPA: hypothetical protein VK524_04100, partial [Polyangiaceae bacterium]|nr:hypothetical protein [Polyangiaceae bacterium]
MLMPIHSRIGFCAALALFTGGCYSSKPGVVRASSDNPMVTIGAGEIEVGSGAAYYARYLIDRRAKLCWFFAGDSVAAIDCCALSSVEEARAHLGWLDPAACNAGPGEHAARA